MSVTITSDITLYSWDSCTVTWDDSYFRTWDDMGIYSFDLQKTVNIILSEKVKKKSAVEALEYILLSDDFRKAITCKVKEAINISEVYWDIILFHLHVLENLSLKDFSEKQFEKLAQDKFSLSDDERNSSVLNLSEACKVTDEMLRKAIFAKVFYEALTVNELLSKRSFPNLYENFEITDYIYKTARLLKKEDIALVDNMLRHWILERIFNEDISAQEFWMKHVKTYKEEAFELFDVMIQACDVILDDILITEGGMSLEQFEETLKTAPGYTSFIEFKVGEYEYQEALVRVVLENQISQTQPSVSNVSMHVDIPDTDDRGTAEVTDTTAPTRVYYNKFYYNPPEVICTLIGGSTANEYVAPAILETFGKDDTGRYFEVELRNTVGERVTGTIRWVSKGY